MKAVCRLIHLFQPYPHLPILGYITLCCHLDGRHQDQPYPQSTSYNPLFGGDYNQLFRLHYIHRHRQKLTKVG